MPIVQNPLAVLAAPPRRFGIELEFVGITQSQARDAISAVNEGRGRNTRWSVKSDGSLHPRRGDGYETTGELVSPPLTSNDAGFEEVKAVCRAMASAGATVNKSCGFHVHLDASDLTGADMALVVARYAANESLINEFMAPSRRGNNYCRLVSQNYPGDAPAILNRLWSGTSSPRSIAVSVDRYCTVNLAAFVRHGTIEFRQHAGTMNWKKVTSWVRFLIAFVEESKSQVRSRIETYLIRNGMTTIPGNNHGSWIDNLLFTEQIDLLLPDLAPGYQYFMSREPRRLTPLRYYAPGFRTASGRRVSLNQMRRWSNANAMSTLYTYYVRRAIHDWLCYQTPGVNNSEYRVSYYEREDGTMFTERRHGSHDGRHFYQFLCAIAHGAYYVVTDRGNATIRNHSMNSAWKFLLRAHEIAYDMLAPQFTPAGAVTRPSVDSFHGNHEINMFWSRFQHLSYNPALISDRAEFFALPPMVPTEGWTSAPVPAAYLLHGFAERNLQGQPAIPTEANMCNFSIFQTPRDSGPTLHLPPEIAMPTISELRSGPTGNLWLGIPGVLGRYFLARREEMIRVAAEREAARVERRAQRALEREARRLQRDAARAAG